MTMGHGVKSRNGRYLDHRRDPNHHAGIVTTDGRVHARRPTTETESMVVLATTVPRAGRAAVRTVLAIHILHDTEDRAGIVTAAATRHGGGDRAARHLRY